jgi:uncharacterized protein (DUF952 family)
MTPSAFKVFTVEQWTGFVTDQEFAGAPVDLTDGFIHLSAADQLEETIRRHFPGMDIHVVEIDLSAYGDAVVWEKSRGGALFPHLYGQPLRFASVIGATFRKTAD